MMKYLMLSCREATRLTEKKLTLGKLSFLDNIQLAMHLRMCDRCKRYAEQSAGIEAALQHRMEEQSGQSTPPEEQPALPDEFKEKLLRRLQQKDGI